MVAHLETEETIGIINSSDLEDAVILDTNYSHLLEELPEGDEKVRIIMLKCKTQQRIEVLKYGLR